MIIWKEKTKSKELQKENKIAKENCEKFKPDLVQNALQQGMCCTQACVCVSARALLDFTEYRTHKSTTFDRLLISWIALIANQ